jgi:hypothetical protein
MGLTGARAKNAAQYKNATKLTVVHKTVAEPL